MLPSKGLHVAAQFKTSSDLFIVQDAKGVDHGDGSAGPFNDVVGIEVEVLFVGHGQD